MPSMLRSHHLSPSEEIRRRDEGAATGAAARRHGAGAGEAGTDSSTPDSGATESVRPRSTPGAAGRPPVRVYFRQQAGRLVTVGGVVGRRAERAPVA